MCDRLCFWFLCEYQQLLEIPRANHVTVRVVGQSERQLSPLALKINKKTEKVRFYQSVLAGLRGSVAHMLKWHFKMSQKYIFSKLSQSLIIESKFVFFIQQQQD